MADLKEELNEAEREFRAFLKPRLLIGAVVLIATALYIFWPH